MQLAVERSDLCLIEKHRDNIIHELELIMYLERSPVRKPTYCLPELENAIREFEHCIDLGREFRIRPPCSWSS